MSTPSVVSLTSASLANIVSAGMSGCRDLTSQGLSLPRTGSHRNAGRPRQHVRLGSIEAAQVTFVDSLVKTFSTTSTSVEDLTLARLSRRSFVAITSTHRGLTSPTSSLATLLAVSLNIHVDLSSPDVLLNGYDGPWSHRCTPRPSLNEDVLQRCLELEPRSACFGSRPTL
ncbi:hypothetical protein BDZ89DRAFT_1129531 [Hymenopellis radicata]|nr:hypothetical protein BDZ89DRAFT_1129531 [Hymenopellis radicata]